MIRTETRSTRYQGCWTNWWWSYFILGRMIRCFNWSRAIGLLLKVRREHWKTDIFAIFCHSERGQTNLVIHSFPSALFVSGTETSHSSVRKGCKHGMQGAEVVDITVGDHFVDLAAWLGAFHQARKVIITVFEHQKKGETNYLNVSSIHWKTFIFDICLT